MLVERGFSLSDDGVWRRYVEFGDTRHVEQFVSFDRETETLYLKGFTELVGNIKHITITGVLEI